MYDIFGNQVNMLYICNMNERVMKLIAAIGEVIDLQGRINIGTYQLYDFLKGYVEYSEINSAYNIIEKELHSLGYEGYIGKHQVEFKIL